MVPHLTTSLTGPLHDLERLVLDRRPEIERWFRSQFAEHEVPWDQIAFRTVRETLKHFFTDRVAGTFTLHVGEVR